MVIPEKYRQDLLTELHVSHPGMVRMKSLARLHVWWGPVWTLILRPKYLGVTPVGLNYPTYLKLQPICGYDQECTLETSTH